MTMGTISSLLWTDMMEIPSILKPKLFHRTILQGRPERELYGKLASVYDAIKDDNRVLDG